MAFTYPQPEDNTDAAVESLCEVRLLITDTDAAHAMYPDSDIKTFLKLSGGVVFLAAALALEGIANKTTLVQKRIETLNLKTDGPACAKDLRAQAATYRVLAADALATQDDEDDEDDEFEIINNVPNRFRSCR